MTEKQPQPFFDPSFYRRIDLYLMISSTVMLLIIVFSTLNDAEISNSIIALAIIFTGTLFIAITGRRYSAFMAQQQQMMEILEKRL